MDPAPRLAPPPTERLAFAHWLPEDAEEWFSIWGDPRVIFWGSHDESLEVSRERLPGLLANYDELPQGQGIFALRPVEGGKAVGNVILRKARYEAPGLEIGWHVRFDCQRKGYATEAARALLRFAFEDLDEDAVNAVILPDNIASRGVAEKLGMQKTGTLMHADLLHDLFVLGRTT